MINNNVVHKTILFVCGQKLLVSSIDKLVLGSFQTKFWSILWTCFHWSESVSVLTIVLLFYVFQEIAIS